MSARTVLGVDPGLGGALAWLRCEPGRRPALLRLERTPILTSTKGAKRQIDLAKLAALLSAPDTRPDMAAVELVGARPGEAAQGSFRFGFVTGAVLGALATLGVETWRPSPPVWRASVGLRPGDDKSRSRARAQALLGDATRHLRLFERAGDHDRAEAVLIALAAVVRAHEPVTEPD